MTAAVAATAAVQPTATVERNAATYTIAFALWRNQRTLEFQQEDDSEKSEVPFRYEGIEMAQNKTVGHLRWRLLAASLCWRRRIRNVFAGL